MLDTDPIAQDTKILVDLVNKHKETIFPKEYFKDLVEILETYVDALEFDEMVVQADTLPEYLNTIAAGSQRKVQKGLSLRTMSGLSSRDELVVSTAALKWTSSTKSSKASSREDEGLYTQIEMASAATQAKGEEQV